MSLYKSLHIVAQLPNGLEANVIIRPQTLKRLARTCFRGVFVCRAGNFMEWNSAETFINDPRILSKLLKCLQELYDEESFGRDKRTEVDCGMPVGWSSTDSSRHYSADELEEFNLNRRSSALFVKHERTDLIAPLTEFVTIIFEFRLEGTKPTAVVHSIYPGRDVGKLEGDMTRRKNVVFFDWSHPGALY